MAARRVAVGRVVGVHGLRGCLRVQYFGDGPDNLMRASSVTLGESEDDRGATTAEVRAVAPGRAGEVRMTLAGIAGREAALGLRGSLVMLASGQLERLPAGEYYEYQLIGCRVEGEDGQAIGTVREIWATGASDVLVVEGAEGRRHLIPAGGAFLREVDVEARRIVIEVVPGLLEES